jgi:hypothetical protein
VKRTYDPEIVLSLKNFSTQIHNNKQTVLCAEVKKSELRRNRRMAKCITIDIDTLDGGILSLTKIDTMLGLPAVNKTEAKVWGKEWIC